MIQSCFNVILKTKTILLGLLCFHLCLPRPLPCPKLPQLPSIVFYWDQLLLGMYLCYGAMLFNPSQTLHPSSFITRLNDLIRWLANPSMQWLKPWLNTSALSLWMHNTGSASFGLLVAFYTLHSASIVSSCGPLIPKAGQPWWIWRTWSQN